MEKDEAILQNVITAFFALLDAPQIYETIFRKEYLISYIFIFSNFTKILRVLIRGQIGDIPTRIEMTWVLKHISSDDSNNFDNDSYFNVCSRPQSLK